MRIAVISAHYMPEVGYQEVHFPRAFARLGHKVKVFTTAAAVKLGGDINKLKYREGVFTDEKYGYEIERLPAVAFKSKAFSFKLRKSVDDFAPQLLLVLGVAKVFPLSLLNSETKAKYKIVSVYGDAKEYLSRNTIKDKVKSFFHDLGYAWIKKPLYKKAVRYCDKIILNIPESDEVFQSFLNGEELKVYEKKRVKLFLGFDPDEYYFTKYDRAEQRSLLGFKEEDIVIITSTRVNRRKNLERNIEFISRLNKEGKKVRYIIVGFLNDNYEKELKQFIQSQQDPSNFKCFPFLSDREIRKLYCAADIGIWLKVAISIQEAMGTGLPVILENKSSVNHLVTDNVNGWYFEKDGFEETMRKAVSLLTQHGTDRLKMAELNRNRLSYDKIAQTILESVQ